MEATRADLNRLSKTLYNLLKFSSQKGKKAKLKCQRSIFSALNFSEADLNILENFVSDCTQGKIWSSDEFLNGDKQYRYNLWDYLTKLQYKPIVESLILETPPIGTPNAHTGEFELMLLLTLHNTVTKPSKNDIHHKNYGTKNIKGGTPRLYTDVSGIDLNRIMLNKFGEYGMNPFVFKSVLYGQLMNQKAIKHFNSEVERLKLNSTQTRDILETWLCQQFPKNLFNDEYFDNILDGVIEDGKLNLKKWEISNLTHIFINSSNKHENFLIFGEDGDIFHLTQNPEYFKSLLYKGTIKPENQFFRLNQIEKCGMYFEVSNQ